VNVGPAESDLVRWIPRLLAAWRGLRRELPRDGRRDPRRDPRRDGRPPPDQLLPDELREVSAAVQRLSVGLTRDRKLAGARYLDDDRLLGAYLLFYWPVSYLQARGVLSELPSRPRSALDLGSGPGPAALAARDAGAAEVMAVDRSTRALAVARTLAVEAGQPIAVREWDPQRRGDLAGLAQGRSFDLVTLGHVVNELFQGEGAATRRAALLEEALGLVAPGGSLVVIEPALRDTSRALLEVRDLLVARGIAVRAPCLFRGACPALVRPTDWCHAERPIDPPALVDEIGRRAGLRKESVKMSYLVIAPRGEGWREPPPGRTFRIVSEPLPSKGRLRYMGCGPEGRMGLALQEKDVTPRNRPFEKLLRGDVVEVTGVEPRGDGLRLSAESDVRVVAAAGRPVP
jgi:SAM-dependent methyltransferase